MEPPRRPALRPEQVGPEGQNWGITGFAPAALERTAFAPFISTLRAALGSAGGIRIDHALGLSRLWVVPEGASARDGAYLTMPLDDMLRVIAIESVRAKAIVIGEDLGTVPPGLRDKMRAREMLGMRVLSFEREADGAFTPPDRYERHAAAMTGTHDLPTIAGWWRGHYIDWAARLGRTHDEAADRAARAEDKARLWRAATEAGVANGAEPAQDDTDPVVDAALAYVGATPSLLTIAPLEDLTGLVEQPNLPGTITEHPNWRRRMPDATQALLDRPEVKRRVGKLNQTRTA